MGALLRGIKREQIKRGQVICAPGSLKSVTKFQAQVYVLTKEEGMWFKFIWFMVGLTAVI
jgi:elongation factor Tu